MVKEKRKHKPYKTTRRYKTKQKTTTPEGRREYMRKYMSDLRKTMKKEKKQLEKLRGR